MSNKSFGVILAAIWFIAWGLLAVTNIEFALSAVLLGVLAIGAGIFLLMGR